MLEGPFGAHEVDDPGRAAGSGLPAFAAVGEEHRLWRNCDCCMLC
jgi:hypothetical protein